MKKVDKIRARLICPNYPALGWSTHWSWPEAG